MYGQLMGATSIMFVSSLVESGKRLTKPVCNKDIYSAMFPAVQLKDRIVGTSAGNG
jgi:hypothetical protein